MRILICSNAYPPNFIGGAELVAHEQAKIFLALGHKVRVFTGEILPNQNDRYKMRHFKHEGIDIFSIGLHAKDFSPEYINFFHDPVDLFFNHILDDFSPDIVHFHNIMGLSLKLPIIAKEKNIKTICTLHDFWGFCLRNTAIYIDNNICVNRNKCLTCLKHEYGDNKKYRHNKFRNDFIKFSFLHIDHFISPSSFLKKEYIKNGLPENKISHLQNGVNPLFISNTLKGSKKTIISFVGYLGYHKGAIILLKALQNIKTNKPIIVFIIGEGPQKEELEKYCQINNINAQINFLGRVPSHQMPYFYRKTHILVLPSLWAENQPVSIMEAMASSCAVIASNIGGIPELLKENRGVTFTPGSYQELTSKLEKLLHDPSHRAEISKNAHEAVQKITYERQSQTLLCIYDDLLSKRRKISYHVNRLFFPKQKRVNEFNIPFTWLKYVDLKFKK
ncbi:MULTISPECIES: glycosyltransferase family 4 protein [Bombella]|uniref:Glycosyltransferase n=1 Tax=Bombella mellum TaxID=2039288 RepID=A0ABR5ZRM7_9PROT|nr:MULTISPECIES: glycosyltransferase family 4 protein [Bombella]MBA5726982.1 hypothetical protein [Bombella mellum]MPW00390.1 glycosyltransferase [Bombella apis]